MIRIKVTIPKGLRVKAQASIGKALNALSMVARDRIVSIAQERLTTSAQTFLNGMSAPVVSDRAFAIKLNTRIAAMIEQGSPPFDMKVMLRGRKFVDVPFRHGVPGSTVLRPMPAADYNVMRNMAKSAKAASFRGPRIMPSGVQTVHREGFGSYQHKAAKTASMLRSSTTYRKTSQVTYSTFRRMSQNSDPASWIHPGLKPLHAFNTVAKEMKKLAPKVVADYVRQGVK